MPFIIRAVPASEPSEPVDYLTVVPGMPVSYGAMTRAAYGSVGVDPKVYRVNSLADTNTVGALQGDGSYINCTFRGACLASGPRIVVFETSGYITLTSSLLISNPYLTIAGQTAPSPGISIRGDQSGIAVDGTPEVIIYFDTNDLLVQHMRFRMGDKNCNNVFTRRGSGTNHAYNVVFANCSFAWGEDDNLNLGTCDVNGGDSDTTIWRCINAEPVNQATGGANCTGGGLANSQCLAIDGGQNVAVIQSLFMSYRERGPFMALYQGGRITLINNLSYNFADEPYFIKMRDDSTPPWRMSCIGNRFICGPNTPSTQYMIFTTGGGTGDPEVLGCQLYFNDNTFTNDVAEGVTMLPHYNSLGYDPTIGSVPVGCETPTNYTPLASTAVESTLVSRIGARPSDRDGIDTRLISEIAARTGSVKSSATLPAYPSLAVNTNTFTMPSNPHVDSGNGYTNLEIALHDAADLLEP